MTIKTLDHVSVVVDDRSVMFTVESVDDTVARLSPQHLRGLALLQ